MAEAWSGGKGWHVEMGPRGQRGQSLGRGRLLGASQGTAAESGWEAVGPGQACSPHGETLCPQRENKGPNPLFPNHCWEVLVTGSRAETLSLHSLTRHCVSLILRFTFIQGSLLLSHKGAILGD